MAFPTKIGKGHFFHGCGGFTLIELLVVMAIIATLLSIATPRYFHSIEKSKEAVLKQDLNTLRDALDKYYGDTGKYPATLDDLVTKKYIRSIPEDPVSGSTVSWLTIAPDNPAKGGVYDVKSGALGNARNGTPYSEW
ncbi:type II secretion system protein G [Sulfuricella denitrificans skB26]|uniref:Type II secretion system protein G n=1 Tax=Sulfuricella denitrificans (strain DSM 22764 / NBRC 105220 / skB26) TaxID=1163617 RepID=S6ABA3_SULDS|nr:prepilin-type N-terminal cleavage/methylation domain-containing protein [Sulfuricella denitrificans]BAN36615.1 type II secretion system protein G [Sulfuricella denitrificans skB26]